MNRIDIQFGTSRKQCPSSREIKKWVNLTLQKTQSAGAIAIKIVDDTEMQALNQQYREKNNPTNILSFPCTLPPELRGDLLGDLVICANVLAREAEQQHKPLTAHWAHIVIHGVLHLQGHDHENSEDALKMETIEIMLLQELGFPNPYELIQGSHITS